MATDIVDLCSDTEEEPSVPPRSTNVRSRQGDDGVIELLSDSEEEQVPIIRSVTLESEDQARSPSIIDTQPSGTVFDHFSVAHQRTFVRNPYKQKPAQLPKKEPFLTPANKSLVTTEPDPVASAPLSVVSTVTSTVYQQCSEVSIVEATQSVLTETTTIVTSDEDAECMIVGQKGDNALADFPHSREDCVVHPMIAAKNAETYCDNCFCYVCDVNVKECNHWKVHCKARFRDHFWKLERSRKRNMGDAYDTTTSNKPRTIKRRNLPPATDGTWFSAHRPSTTVPPPVTPTFANQTASTPGLATPPPPNTDNSVIIPLAVSPWLNTVTKLIGVQLTAEERNLYNTARESRKSSYDPSIFRAGALPSYLEIHVTGPLSIYELTKDWLLPQLEKSSKIQALVAELVAIRKKDPYIHAIVFCEDKRWRLAISQALQKENFRTDDDLKKNYKLGGSGYVWIRSTLKNEYYPTFSVAFFMEQYVNMASESTALGRIKRPTGHQMDIKKMVLRGTAEENVVNFQNALITGESKMTKNFAEVDKAGVAIILQGLA